MAGVRPSSMVFGGWFWILPPATMSLCFAVVFIGVKKGKMMCCSAMHHAYRSKGGRRPGESVEDVVRCRYAAGEIEREGFQHIIADLAKR